MSESNPPDLNFSALCEQIRQWGEELGFQQIAIGDIALNTAGNHLNDWLNNGYHGEMNWMVEHGDKRHRPEKLLPGTQRVISARMDYLGDDGDLAALLQEKDRAYISRYALGRDYHKLIRKRLTTLAKHIEYAVAKLSLPGPVVLRPFVDSAPVMEKPLAENAGLGWIGKNTLLLNHEAGSWFFLGEIYTNLPLPIDRELATNTAQKNECGNCRACLKACPTDAFPEPYLLDARRCISYLTIEHRGPIPEDLRRPMGNRIFGCDDCQIICPWNRYAKPTSERDFSPRHGLENASLLELFLWTEKEFLKRSEGSPIRRIGYERWLRNLAVGLGNAPANKNIVTALQSRREQVSELVREHIDWALEQQISDAI